MLVFIKWPKFSLRFLLCLPVFLMVILTSRSLTIRYGEADVTQYVAEHPQHGTANAKYYIPFILECSTLGVVPGGKSAVTKRWYYLWFFGYVGELPIKRQHIDLITSDKTFPDIADERLLNRGF